MQAPIENVSPPNLEVLETTPGSVVVSPQSPAKISKDAIRSSLKASAWDAVFAAIFGNITGGVLLSNFLLQLGAGPMEIGMLSSVPMLVNLLQPLGAYLSEQTTSRYWYNVWIYGPSRLLWLILVLAIGWISWHHTDLHTLVGLTLGIVLATNVVGALGSANWMSWMAVLVPERLRGRYFGIRNSVTSLTTLLGIPLLGLAVSAWPSGTIQGYAVVLVLGVVMGLISLGCQFFMADVNPRMQFAAAGESGEVGEVPPLTPSPQHPLSLSRFEPNFLRFLLYFGFWAFAVNICTPFFGLYLLDNLDIGVTWVTFYSSLTSAATLVMMVVWGKLADRMGNRPLLVFVGILVAVTPLFWLGLGADPISIWIWFPLLHLMMGGTWAAIDLCSNNLQMSVASGRNQSTYFAIAAAVAGVCGALGTTTGGFLASQVNFGGLQAVFALSAALRLIALLALVFVQEKRSTPLSQVMRSLVPSKPQLLPVPLVVPGVEQSRLNPEPVEVPE
ncbi:MFS transporter [Funiculus sociatus GB2-A5]|uniref:MFS transporter n=1 Tax=Funiculus sociatus GB2-A5 TaxID=2933946 RepID=A0ABV0JIM1_9CYAN|nr:MULTISPECIES: MFS transporter [unclassified Trichocoleus]MBD1904626.1 MFS transporter [Trichocoleus sp. FACHB-832]MBD2062425.1 MFS transporter [Trichocoleus sp. FACHB-6]